MSGTGFRYPFANSVGGWRFWRTRLELRLVRCAMSACGGDSKTPKNKVSKR